MINLLAEYKYYRWFLFGLVLAGGISFLVIFLLVWAGPLRTLVPDPTYFPGRDFKPLYENAVALSRGQVPASLYFIYFPLTILFYFPLGLMSFNQAFIVMTLLNLLLSLVMAVAAYKIIDFHGVKLHPAMVIVFFMAYIFFCPATAEITSANVNTLVACFVTLFYYFLFVKKKDIPAAICLVIATLFKVFPAFLILLAILSRRYKFTLIFVAFLSSSVVISVLLLGLPAHLNWIAFISSENQGGAALTLGHNITLTAVIYKFLSVLGITVTAQQVTFNIAWLVIRAALVIIILFLLFPASKKHSSGPNSGRWMILTYALLSLLMLILPNTAWVYYATCLALPFLLCVICLKLSIFDRIIIALSLMFFSFNTHIANLAVFMGGVAGRLVYVLHPASIGNLLYLLFILCYMIRLNRGEAVNETLNCDSRI